MSHAYTPGLKVTENHLVRKRRILPIKGEVLKTVGDFVEPDDIIARTFLPGEVIPLNVANILGIDPEETSASMLKKEGDKIAKDEVIGRSKGFLGLFKAEAKSKIEGTIENISNVTGQVMLRGHPQAVQVKAYLKGKVVEVIPNEGVIVENTGVFIQGIFGVGGEIHGAIAFACTSNCDVLDETHVKDAHKGKVIVGGCMVTAAAIKKAIKIGVAGIVVGGLDDKDLRAFLGYDLGVAITGHEDIGITLIVTEGFGVINMAQRTSELLKKFEGKEACINGATQIRAGVIRPEIIVPMTSTPQEAAVKGDMHGLDIGSKIRVIRQPYFGKLGKVTNLPPELMVLESGSKARILEVEFFEGGKSIIPRANVELIEEQ